MASLMAWRKPSFALHEADHEALARQAKQDGSAGLLPASYIMCDNGLMADTITFRPDEDASRALDVLTRDGTPVSTVVRAALIDAARNQARSVLRAEAELLAADEQDRAEAAQVLRDMEQLRAW